MARGGASPEGTGAIEGGKRRERAQKFAFIYSTVRFDDDDDVDKPVSSYKETKNNRCLSIRNGHSSNSASPLASLSSWLDGIQATLRSLLTVVPLMLSFFMIFRQYNLFSESVEHTASVDRTKCYFNQICKQEQVDDLNLTSGEIVYLLEKIDTDWYRGKCRNQTGVFPATYVKVITDVPGGNGKRESVASHCVKGPRCVARFEYIGDQKDELSFSEGEIIILKEYVNDEWARGELRERSGIFPLNFVELIEDHPTSGTNVLKWCEALHSFTAETSDDLSFKRGDRILIMERVDPDWYKGRLRDREGIFPAVFVRPCPAEAKSMAALALKGRKAKALYDFHGENEDELSFKAGDIITELESVDDDWMSGELRGKSGIFPKTYIQFLQVG
eukprot:bmy_09114T0